jgi:hypothetical protein
MALSVEFIQAAAALQMPKKESSSTDPQVEAIVAYLTGESDHAPSLPDFAYEKIEATQPPSKTDIYANKTHFAETSTSIAETNPQPENSTPSSQKAPTTIVSFPKVVAKAS